MVNLVWMWESENWILDLGLNKLSSHLLHWCFSQVQPTIFWQQFSSPTIWIDIAGIFFREKGAIWWFPRPLDKSHRQDDITIDSGIASLRLSWIIDDCYGLSHLLGLRIHGSIEQFSSTAAYWGGTSQPFTTSFCSGGESLISKHLGLQPECFDWDFRWISWKWWQDQLGYLQWDIAR